MIIKELNGKTPQFGDDCFLAENCVVIGDVVMGNDCSVWYNAVIRGDVHSIKMGNKVNIQDGAVVHATYKKHPTVIGNSVSVGHNAIVHGCTIYDNVLVGMGAIVMDDCVLESNCIIAAGAVVTKGTRVASGSVYAGTPAKKIKDLSEALLKGEVERIAESYLTYASWYKK
ncbi:gamma carbonic anhydrase family protein [Ochrovirga pacifica]|uniref:gamma carbonic anhydrase family protein n=1 Tax=Ochrovirga pacifica TaxID=1042376 RepID=UPI00025591B8|nr:gamma carbonic anhydrase family protein [Ochrovirga pacifica]